VWIRITIDILRSRLYWVVCTKCKLLDRGVMETSNRSALCSGKAQYVFFNGLGSNTDRDTAYHDGLSPLFFSFLSCSTGILRILDSSVGIMTKLRGWFLKKSWFDSRKGQKFYVFFLRLQTSSEMHPTSGSLGSRDSFSSGRATGVWSFTLTPSNTKVKNQWISSFTPPYVFCCYCFEN
jgi:hypothetical protein